MASLRAGAGNRTAYTAAASRGLVNVVPDLPVGTRFGIADAKDVVDINNTRQIQGFAGLARQQRLPFTLIISPRTDYIAGSVTRAITNSNGTIFQFDPATNSWTNIVFTGGTAWSR